MSSPPLEVRHSPNPCDQHVSPAFAQDPFPFMWYYQTELRNNTDRPLRVTWFEAYQLRGGQWVANNIKGRALDGDDFRGWYGGPDGQRAEGPIAPGSSAVCDVNWHGAPCPWSQPVKWVFRAVDDEGHVYEAESQVVSKLIVNKRSIRWFAVRTIGLILLGVVLWLVAKQP